MNGTPAPSSEHVTVVDYGRGNLLSVARALQHCGAAVEITDDPARVRTADRLVLPGVGAFGDAMSELERRGLVAAIRDFAATGRPFLGICLGMQLMLDHSEEFGRHPGLGLIAGGVTPLPPTGVDGQPHRIPHIGWNVLLPRGTGRGPWDGTILAGVEPGACVYFVHSFAAEPSAPDSVIARSDYDGRPITAVIRRGSLYGCQFHPEKSAATGLRILGNFLVQAATRPPRAVALDVNAS